jgi:hypothetical protein
LKAREVSRTFEPFSADQSRSRPRELSDCATRVTCKTPVAAGIDALIEATEVLLVFIYQGCAAR